MIPQWFDPEADAALNADEKEVYWWVYTDKRRTDSPRFIKRYKPSFARLMAKRCGWRIEQVFKEGR